MNKKQTVLQVLPELNSGGVEKGTLEVARALVQQGYRSLVMSDGGRLVKQLESEGSTHFQWAIGKKSIRTLLLIAPIRRFLKREKVDVIHVRSRLPAWIVYLAWFTMKSESRPRLVSTVHGFYSVSWYSAVMAKGEVVIAVSASVKKYILDHYIAKDSDRIKVIYRGIDPTLYPYGFKPETSWINQYLEKYPILKHKKIITLPGRVTRLKGHEDFIRVIEALTDVDESVIGVIAGGVDSKKRAYYETLKQSIASKGLNQHIVFLGHRTDLKEVMAFSDVILSLTKQPESFGRTTLEALSMGVPVCGYAHGGVGEQLDVILPEGKVMVDDVSSVVNVIKKWFIKSPRIKKEHPFLLDNMLHQTLQVYAQLAVKK